MTPSPTELTRPIIGIENRSAQEVFDIMCDRIRSALVSAPAVPDAVTDEMIETAAKELLAHGEFSSIPCNNQPNARIAARAALTAALTASYMPVGDGRKSTEDELVATFKVAVDTDGEPLQMSFKGWPKEQGYRFLAKFVLADPSAPAGGSGNE